MKRSNRLVILVGVLLAVVAFVLVVVLLNQQKTATSSEQPAKTKVLVAKQAIELGTSVTPDMVEVKEVDPNAVSGTPLHDPSQVSGRTALVNVPSQAQVTQETFGVGNAVFNLGAQLKPGEKAIAFQVDRMTGLNFLIQPGDMIDIVLSEQMPGEMSPPGTSLRSVKTVLQNKRVLYVSATNVKQTAPAASGSASPTGQAGQPTEAPTTVFVVFAGTDQDAEIIKFAQVNEGEITGGSGSLTVVVRHPEDTADEETSGITIDRLIDDYGVIVPNISEIDTGASPSASPQ